MPQRPPAARTAIGFLWASVPLNVVNSCLLLSYVAKYIPVPNVSRTIKVSVWLEEGSRGRAAKPPVNEFLTQMQV